MFYPSLFYGGAAVVSVLVGLLVYFIILSPELPVRHWLKLVAVFLVAIVCMVFGGVKHEAEKDDRRAEAAAEAAEAEAEKKSAVADLARIHGVSITRWPDNTAEPGVWKVNGQFFTCYAEGVPDEHATELEQAADPVLMCEEPSGTFMPIDTWVGVQP